MGARDDVNRSYYGDNLVTPAMILSGTSFFRDFFVYACDRFEYVICVLIV